MRTQQRDIAPAGPSPLSFFLGLLPSFALGIWLMSRFGFGRYRAFVAAYAPLLVFVAFVRPAWFWNHGATRGVRNLMGERGARGFYLVLAALFTYLALTGPTWLRP